jgi:hypothetical protein
MRCKLLDTMMSEHVEMPGFPQVIVQRGWLYQFLKGCGWSESERGFASLDYTVFARKAVDLPLTEPAQRDYWLNKVRAEIYDRTD